MYFHFFQMLVIEKLFNASKINTALELVINSRFALVMLAAQGPPKPHVAGNVVFINGKTEPWEGKTTAVSISICLRCVCVCVCVFVCSVAFELHTFFEIS